MKTFSKIVLLFILIIGFYFLFNIKENTIISSPTQKVSTNPSSPFVLGVKTKSSGCVSQNALPDKDCTPGQAMSNVTKDQICVSGYSKSVRNVPESEKQAVYEEYGIFQRTKGEYEVDHLVSLELGGSNDISNLWPEPADPRPGFHEKDKVENYLHEQVCNRQISLVQAQEEVANNWLEVYKQLPNY